MNYPHLTPLTLNLNSDFALNNCFGEKRLLT